ncbi:invasion protein CiaB [Sulfurospirillum sp. 1612]|uniref:invasion protein CiaB n=1 Tax=Sulfurospirillum sp. 1612 TaxID=3094835 RepID=UPI002F92FE1A
MREKFTKDLSRLYELVSQNQKELGTLYKLVEEEGYVNDAVKIYIDEFLDECDLAHTKENTLALLSRLISLRDEQLNQVLQQQDITKKARDTKRALAYLWTKNFHMKRHEKLLEVIEDEQLFNPFYRTLLRGFHDVGVTLSLWQFDWNAHIIDTINPQLESRFGDDALKYLSENNLLEIDETGAISDRAYSVLSPKGEGYEVLTYAQYFKEDVQTVVHQLETLIQALMMLEDEDTHQKTEYIDYLTALKDAFAQKDRTKLLTDWKAVDRAWMKITSPIQLGHPLEYYEDHFRKAVALEWDVRLSNPKNLGANKVYDAMVAMYESLFHKIGKGYEHVLERTEKNLNRVQLYIGRPAFYYASEFNGLFSAQVVPNDEDVSKEAGKKIFAFADNVLDAQRAKPFLKINKIVFGDEFLNQERALIFREEALWHEVYQVSTIGHEYGHILWLDSDTEMIMNHSGVFKNIEEFKATTGGLVAFFMNENPKIKKHIFIELIKRAVSLIAWKTSGEVEPYYCEGLIHLKALFDSGVLDFDATLHIHMNDETYESLKAWYLEHYEKLAAHYLAKKDAKAFLDNFAYKENSYYVPQDAKVKSFVDYYWNLHKSIGREIDETSQKSNWI